VLHSLFLKRISIKSKYIVCIDRRSSFLIGRKGASQVEYSYDSEPNVEESNG